MANSIIEEYNRQFNAGSNSNSLQISTQDLINLQSLQILDGSQKQKQKSAFDQDVNQLMIALQVASHF